MNLAKHYRIETIEAGVDEAGRGCLAGPVFASAVILPSDFPFELLDDSKKLSEKKRKELRKIIEAKAVAWSIGIVDNLEIDTINILQASILAMHRAIDNLSTKPELLLIDGNKFNKYQDIEHQTIIKGDGKLCSIAAASILAKTHRDEYMHKIAAEYPVYEWSQNKGYPTAKHRELIAKHGITPYHRITFRLQKDS
ncbi:MAG: ribonuclease HII [Bacteroidales bacterium]